MMNNIPLTSIFASLFTIFYLFLSFRIGYLRGKHAQKKVTAIKLDRNVRAHGNFSEYVPLFLILLYIFESVDLISFKYLLIICLVFSYGRVAHAICFAFYDYNPFLRISGMVSTYLGLAFLSILLFFFIHSLNKSS